MPDPVPPGADFESRLQREVERVLADPAFERSPVQSRLLAYLCEQTIARNRNISQIAIAVDGLGRPETIDQLTESYPRVQISRLRRNLSLYYARCAPGEGLAVYIRHGDYQLRLAAPENAYGEQRQRGPRPAPANDSAPPEPTVAAAPVPRRRRVWRRGYLVAALIGGLALATASLWLSNRLSRGTAATAPAFEVWVESAGTGAPPDPLLALAAQHADDIASNSYVVRNLRETDDRPGYTVRLQRSQSLDDRPLLEVSLFDRDNQRLFHDSIPIGANRASVLTRLNGALLQIVKPAGVIAKHELADVGDVPRSDYECVLKTESDRLEGGLRTALVESCLDRFPQSPYRAYWVGRMAFLGYREQILSGGVVATRGAAWQNLQQALAADATNPFANYMAGKVSTSVGECTAARPYFERTLNNGNYSGVLTAAAASEEALCTAGPGRDEELGARVESLADAIPDPNPLLYLYLVFATAAVDRPDLAHRVLTTPISEEPNGSMADIHAALKDALASPAAFADNRDRLQRVVDGFYWEPRQREAMMDKLAAVAAYGSEGAAA
jgi:hypothetical protein